MVDHCDKRVNLENFVFDGENHERKSWKMFGRTCNRSLLVFVSFFVIVLMLVSAIVRIKLSTECEETTVWVAIFQNFKIQIICKNCYCWEKQGTEYNIHQTQLFSSKQIRNKCRITKYTQGLVQVAAGCFTNQYIRSTTRSRISIERVVSRCNIRSLWSFT